MKTQWIVKSLSALIVVLNAISAMAVLPTGKALEILDLPDSSRLVTAKAKKEALFPELVRLAFSSDRNMEVRWKALNLAAQLDYAKALPELRRALGQREWFMKNAALVAIRNVQPELAEQYALRLLTDPALVVRSAALSAISDRPSQATRNILWTEMRRKYNYHRGTSLWVRSEILEKLARNPMAGELPLFAAAMREDEMRMQVAAIGGLEKLTGKKLGSPYATLGEQKSLWRAEVARSRVAVE